MFTCHSSKPGKSTSAASGSSASNPRNVVPPIEPTVSCRSKQSSPLQSLHPTSCASKKAVISVSVKSATPVTLTTVSGAIRFGQKECLSTVFARSPSFLYTSLMVYGPSRPSCPSMRTLETAGSRSEVSKGTAVRSTSLPQSSVNLAAVHLPRVTTGLVSYEFIHSSCVGRRMISVDFSAGQHTLSDQSLSCIMQSTRVFVLEFPSL